MSNFKIFFFFLFSLSIVACNQGEKSSTKKTEEEKAVVENIEKQQINEVLVPLPADIFRTIYFETDFLDVIFENLPFSMSQDNSTSIQSILKQVDIKAPQSVNTNCPLFGQQVFQKEGEVIAEADFYHAEGCYYYIFTVNGKKYYNAMMPTGIEFYENLKQGNFGN